MAEAKEGQQFLPKDIMEMQLTSIDLLLAMYPEATLEPSSQAPLDALTAWCSSSSTTTTTSSPSPSSPPSNTPSHLSLVVDLEIETPDHQSHEPRPLQLDLSVPLLFPGPDPPADPPNPRVRIRQPPWLSKAETAALAVEVPDTDVLGALEAVKEACARRLADSSHDQLHPSTFSTSSSLATPNGSVGPDPNNENNNNTTTVVRVWFYFPSISTRSKRADLIQHAPSYNLTGFLLAGKPGVLCVETASPNGPAAAARRVDDYMRFVKTQSWGDIPAAHKKVSERYREQGPVGLVNRVFPDMQEITHLVGERRGERANRTDMRALEAWLGERGLAGALEKVLM